MIYYIVQAKSHFNYRKEFTKLKDAEKDIDYFRQTFGESCANIFEIIKEERIGTNQAKTVFDKRVNWRTKK